VSGRQRFARVDERALPFAVGEEPRAPRRRRQLSTRDFPRLFPERRAAADRLDRYRLDHQLFFAVDEAEPRLVSALEGGLHRLQLSELQPSAYGKAKYTSLDD
jgi:hypothetical protein